MSKDQNKEYLNLMIDLEFLDRNETAVISSIGITPIFGSIRSSYYLPVESRMFVFNIQEQIDAGRTMNYETLYWWGNQSDEARLHLSPEFQENVSKNIYAIREIADFLQSLKRSIQTGKPVELIWWGNGVREDNAKWWHFINSNPDYRIALNEDLMHWRKFRCYRTLKNLFNVDTSNLTLGVDNSSHLPHEDSVNQAKHLIEIAHKYKIELK